MNIHINYATISFMKKETYNGNGIENGTDNKYKKIGRLTGFYPKGKEPIGLFEYRHVAGRSGTGTRVTPLTREALISQFNTSNSGDLGKGISKESIRRAKRKNRNHLDA